jgi:hypothetical protein
VRCRSTFPDKTKVSPAYSVLPCVSTSYPQHQGRSPTCYSPVRHSHGVAPTAVRLACLKRAASVRSEPGSNSPSYIPWLAPRLYNQSNPVSLAFSLSILSLNYFHRTMVSDSRQSPTTSLVVFECEKDFTAFLITLSIRFCNFRCFLSLTDRRA